MKKKKDKKPKGSVQYSKKNSDLGKHRINQPVEVSKEDFDRLVERMLGNKVERK